MMLSIVTEMEEGVVECVTLVLQQEDVEEEL